MQSAQARPCPFFVFHWVIDAVATPLHQQIQKRRDPDPKGNGQARGSVKRPSTTLPPQVKKLKVGNAKVTIVDLTREDFDSCIRVSKLGEDLFIKWNVDVVEREKGNLLEARNLWLESELLDKTNNLKCVRNVILVEMWEERDRFKEERDTLEAKVNNLPSGEEEVE